MVNHCYSKFFLEKEILTKVHLQFFKFQTLSDNYLEDNLPFIRPTITIHGIT